MKSHEIKDILEERRIEASENSWEKLAGKLDANDQKNGKKKFYYVYAACLALLVSLLVFMFAKSTTNLGDDIIVKEDNTSKSIIKKENLQKTIIPIIEEKEQKEQKNTIDKTQIAIEEKALNNRKKSIIKKQIDPQAKEQLTAELHKEVRQEIISSEKENQPKIKTIIAQKEVIADVDSTLKKSIVALLQEEKVAITNAEIDQLLQEAQQSLSELDIKIKEENVDVTRFATADELLNDVEYELDMSFKQRVFQLIKEKVKKRTVAVED